MWKIINNFREKTEPNNNKTNIEPDEFNEYFSNMAYDLIHNIPETNHDPLLHLRAASISTDCQFKFDEVTYVELRDIICNLKNKKNTDYLGLSVKMLKVIKNLIYIPLTKLINLCFKENTFPSKLKHAIVCPIFKKGDRDSPSNYRPISLLPVFSKVIEKCMANRITGFFEQNNLFTECQFGFRQGRSTIQGILNLVNIMMDAFENREYNATIFCDLSKAFDCVTHDLLLSKLKLYNFHPDSIKMLQSYLEGRTQVVRLEGVLSAKREARVGVPQGSILGPLLFLIYINDLPLTGPSTAFTLFADDTSLSRNGETPAVISDELAVTQLGAEEWFKANKLLLNADKTHTMISSLRDLPDQSRQVDHVRFLGVHIDNKLKFDVHVDFVCGKLAKSAYALRGLSGCVSDKVLRTTYFSLFHSILTYAILVWGHSCQSFRVFALQRRAIRILAHLSYREECRDAFRSLKILTFPSVYILENLMYVKQNEDKYRTHSELHEYDTRNKGELAVAYRRLKRCQNGPKFLGIKLYNKLPTNVKTLTLKKFKTALKNFLAKQAFYSVQEFISCDVKTIM